MRVNPARHSSRYGRMFRIGDTVLYVGPPEYGPGAPILSYGRVGDADSSTLVCEFPNATTAELFIAALAEGITEARTTAARNQGLLVDNEATTNERQS